MSTAEKETHATREAGHAWREYLESTRGLDSPSYKEVEPHAWKILKDKLRKLGVRVHG